MSPLRAIVALVVFALACEASTAEHAKTPRALDLAMPEWVEPAGPSDPALWATPARGPSIRLQGDPGALVADGPRPPAPPSAPSEAKRAKAPEPAATSTFFPKSHDARMFGGCAANEYSGEKCPDENH
jgi:hypothetical protein